ncbi:MAG: hypothetical protein KF791_02250 [Verrucomicrobiae bacterium]|nr:hypothetical protein [Verrucomicrobiae bacterium]
MKPVRTLPWPILAALALAVAVAGWTLWVRYGPVREDPRLARFRAMGFPTTPAALDVWYATVPPGDNAAPKILDSAAVLSAARRDSDLIWIGSAKLPDPGDALPAEPRAAARQFLELHAEPIHALHQELKRPGCRYPTDFTKGYLTLLPHLAPLKAAAQVLAMEAHLAAEEGRPDDAVAAILTCLRLAETVGQEPVLISYLVAVAIRGIGTSAAEHVVNRTALSPPLLEGLRDAFLNAAATAQPTRGLAGELIFFTDALRMSPGKLTGAGGFNAPGGGAPNWIGDAALQLYWGLGLQSRDRRVGLDYLLEVIEVSRAPLSEHPAGRQRVQAATARFERSSHRMPFARMFVSAIGRTFDRHLADVSRLHAAAAACGVELWRLRHEGACPESLELLVPADLPFVPMDPVTGNPLQYRRQDPGYVVYGVGTDGQDDGGLSRRQRPKGLNAGVDETFVRTR